MAFLDFLNKGIGGTVPQETMPGLQGEGNVVTRAATPIGPTYGDITKAALMYGSKPGSSAPMLASGLLPDSGWAEKQMASLVPRPQSAKSVLNRPKRDPDSLNQIANFLKGIFGL